MNDIPLDDIGEFATLMSEIAPHDHKESLDNNTYQQICEEIVTFIDVDTYGGSIIKVPLDFDYALTQNNHHFCFIYIPNE